MIRKPVTTFAALILCLWSFAQSPQQVYIDAKYNLKQENYNEAVSQFSSLVADPVFGPYATFYLGLTYHKSGANQNALDAWRQLLAKFPGFDQKEEINFWMTNVFFEQGDYQKAIQYGQQIADASSRLAIYRAGLDSVSFSKLRELYSIYPEDTELAKVIVRKGLSSDLSERDQFFLKGVQGLHEVEASSFGEYPVVLKNQYSIGVMLPFLFDDLARTDRILRNALVMDLYQGMLLAEEMLAEEGIDLELYPYDTQRDSLQTEILLRSKGIKEMDLLVGPLFPKPLAIINKFSAENKIPILNPISSNSVVLGENPYALLWKPTYETMARKTADYMAATSSKFEANIYFEDTSTERKFAEEYKERIEGHGFTVTDFRPIDSRTAREVLAQFTDQEEVVLRMTPEQVEKELEEGRLIREREVFDASGRLITNEDGTPRLEYYELVFTADTDSLDHILALTRSNLLANNFVGAVESISDTVRLIGLGDWLDFSMLDYRQLSRLNVNLVDANFIDRKSDFFKKVEKRFEQRFNKSPNQFNLSGFESIWWAGNMMKKYGKYFQNGLSDEQDFPCVYYGHEYVFGQRDNQIVPILRFEENELKAVNLLPIIEEEIVDDGAKEGDE